MPPKMTKRKGSPKYQWMKHQEHVLTRPSMYLGTTDMGEQPGYFPATPILHGHIGLTPQTVKHVQALTCMLNELLCNSADNKQRELEAGVPAAKAITKDVYLTFGEDGGICVRNNGPTVPLTPMGKPPFEDVLTPAVVFGMLLSGTNFDDSEERTTGGCNGLGSKLTNIFSTKFEVKICDGSGKEGTFTWTRNMSEKPQDVPVRLRKGGKRSFTQVTFWPDLDRFGLDALPPGFHAVARRRLLDLAACATARAPQ